MNSEKGSELADQDNLSQSLWPNPAWSLIFKKLNRYKTLLELVFSGVIQRAVKMSCSSDAPQSLDPVKFSLSLSL